MPDPLSNEKCCCVAPFAGAWIEIPASGRMTSLRIVAPFAGAWIEMASILGTSPSDSSVAPFAGAWIEIADKAKQILEQYGSLPSRERGLKYRQSKYRYSHLCRSLRGSVD